MKLLTSALDGLTLSLTANYEMNQRRRDAIKQQFKAEFAKGLCSASNPADEFLFGGDTFKRVKEITELQKSRGVQGPGHSKYLWAKSFCPIRGDIVEVEAEVLVPRPTLRSLVTNNLRLLRSRLRHLIIGM